MSLDATLKNGVATIFNALGDLKLTITYRQVTPGSYDPSTDAVTVTEVTHNNVPSLRGRFTEDDADWIHPNMRTIKLLIPYRSLPIVPSDDDYVLIGGVRWNVHKIKSIPGDSLHTLFVREP